MTEIMVVVGVIGLLAIIALPAFQLARERALTYTKQTNVRLVNDSVERWAMSNFVQDGYPITEDVVDSRPPLILSTTSSLDIIDYGYPITEDVVDNIKGGLESLSVGDSEVEVSELTSQKVGHIFTIEDLY